VFRTGESLQSRRQEDRRGHAAFADIGVTDRGLIWNTDLIETLELDNLLGQAAGT
jgi:succinate dehydrogenase / fumarate reductase flavoprotein subunit